jgi:hypothetical protein
MHAGARKRGAYGATLSAAGRPEPAGLPLRRQRMLSFSLPPTTRSRSLRATFPPASARPSATAPSPPAARTPTLPSRSAPLPPPSRAPRPRCGGCRPAAGSSRRRRASGPRRARRRSGRRAAQRCRRDAGASRRALAARQPWLARRASNRRAHCLSKDAPKDVSCFCSCSLRFGMKSPSQASRARPSCQAARLLLGWQAASHPRWLPLAARAAPRMHLGFVPSRICPMLRMAMVRGCRQRRIRAAWRAGFQQGKASRAVLGLV